MTTIIASVIHNYWAIVGAGTVLTLAVVWYLVGLAEISDSIRESVITLKTDLPAKIDTSVANLKGDIDESVRNLGVELGRTVALGTADALYSQAIKLLDDSWEAVYIYAPVGLWHPSKEKGEWLKAVSTAFQNGRICKLAGVFGGPLAENREQIELTVKRFQLLAGVHPNSLPVAPVLMTGSEPSANAPMLDLHYLPPPDGEHPTAASGIGGIYFRHRDPSNSRVIFGFTPGDTGLNQGFMLRQPAICQAIADWFENHPLKVAGTFVIVGVDPIERGRVGFTEGIADYLSWYPETADWPRKRRSRTVPLKRPGSYPQPPAAVV